MRYRFRGRWRAGCLERERSHNFGFHPNLLSDLGDLQHNACGLRVPRSVSVGRSEERDLLEVPGHERYRAIMFRVESGDLVLDDLKVTFGDDSSFGTAIERNR